MTVASTEGLRSAVATQAAPPQDSIASWMESNQEQFARALGSMVDAKRFVAFALTAVKKTPELLKCTPESMLAALMLSAQVNLYPGPLGHIFLTPRNRKIKTDNGDRWIKEVQFSIGYKGLVALAMRSPQIIKVAGRCVYANDVFTVEYGLHENLIHVPNITSDRGEVVGSYAVADWANGAKSFVYLTREDCDARKAASGSGDYGPWKTHYAAMATKSAVHELAKYLPLDETAQQAVALDEQVHTDASLDLEARSPQAFDSVGFVESQAAIEPLRHDGPLSPGESIPGVVVPEGSGDAPEPPQAPAPASRGRRVAAPEGVVDPDTGEVVPDDGGWPETAKPGSKA